MDAADEASTPVGANPLSTLLRTRRWERGWSLSQAASAIGCSKGHLWEMEDGRVANASISLLSDIAKAYKLSLADVCLAASLSVASKGGDQ